MSLITKYVSFTCVFVSLVLYALSLDTTFFFPVVCNGNGVFVGDECFCAYGYDGEFCEEVDYGFGTLDLTDEDVEDMPIKLFKKDYRESSATYSFSYRTASGSGYSTASSYVPQSTATVSSSAVLMPTVSISSASTEGTGLPLAALTANIMEAETSHPNFYPPFFLVLCLRN